jgi:hypothetical protein
MRNRLAGLCVTTVAVTVILSVSLTPAAAQPPTPEGKKLAGPSGPVPRMADGKPDLSGVWERPFVVDMTRSAPNQKGAGELPLTPWGKANLVEEFDYSAHCLPLGYTRGINSPMPVEIAQRPGRVVLLYEMNNTFHVIFTDGRGHPKDMDPNWNGHSIGKWEGDTLVVETVGFNGKTRVDTMGHPHSDALHVVERFQRTDLGHISYEVTIEDPQAYTKPWKNSRVFTLRPDWELQEYNCNENNKDVVESHIK